VPGRPSFNFGNARIAVDLPNGARFVAVPDGKPGWAFIQRNGWIRTKLGWFTARGTPHVSGRRVDRTGRPLRADIGPLSSAPGGAFYPSLLYFPSLGCWSITATAAGARLTAVVNVVRSTEPKAVHRLVLGSRTSFEPYGKGWGTAQPVAVDNGGDPSGKAWGVRWTRSGAP